MEESCCICYKSQLMIKNIYQECIHSTCTPIVEVIEECLQGTDYSLQNDGVCIKCLKFLTKYYTTSRLAVQIKNEIMKKVLKPSRIKPEAVSIEDDEHAIVDAIEFKEQMDDGGIKTEFIKLEQLSDESLLTEEECISPEDYNEDCLPQDEYTCEIEILTEIKHKAPSRNKIKDNSDIHCSECGEVFKNQRSYRSHYKKQHFSGYMCDLCGKKLNSYSGFFAHKQMHDPVKPHECEQCGERFRHERQLNYHRAWHTGEKPYQCEICSKQFVHKVALYKHKQIHDNNNRKFECDVCSAKFRTSAHLRRHRMTHTGAKPHCCHVCGKCFAQAYNMRVHLKEHQMPGSTRQRRYKCPRCSSTFTNQNNFETHVKLSNCVPSE